MAENVSNNNQMKYIALALLLAVATAIEINYCQPPAYSSDIEVYQSNIQVQQSIAFDLGKKKGVIFDKKSSTASYFVDDKIYFHTNDRCVKAPGSFPWEVKCQVVKVDSIRPLTIAGVKAYSIALNGTQLFVAKDKYPDTYILISGITNTPSTTAQYFLNYESADTLKDQSVFELPESCKKINNIGVAREAKQIEQSFLSKLTFGAFQ
ncbi:RhoGAP [Acrasis kona]|uniref:RhoGAP n=1 Tax=Acrasis kona TaxID=1008807 RepID=A0AAW2ZTM2_9EUKA